jgi:hypothetical protein
MTKLRRKLIYLVLLAAVFGLMDLIVIGGQDLNIKCQILSWVGLRGSSHAVVSVSPTSTLPLPPEASQPPPAGGPGSVEKPIDTVGWVVYRNTNYGFGFRHPQDHTVFSEVNQETKTFVPADARSNYLEIAEDESRVFSGAPILLSFEVANVDQPFDSWLNNNLERVIPKDKMVSKEDIMFAGKPAVEVIGKETPGGVYRLILMKPGNFFIIALQNKPSKFLDAVLGTFSFNPSELH